MESPKLTKSEFIQRGMALAAPILTAVAILLLTFGYLAPDPADNQPEARGVTNFDDLTLSGDLTVAGALDVSGAPTFGSGNLYPLLVDDSSEAIYAASTTITGTLAITASTHSLSAITAAFCTLAESPGTGAGDGALCWVGVSGTTATITVEQDDWTTNAANGTAVHYAIIGTP